jgi:hypothetical protein
VRRHPPRQEEKAGADPTDTRKKVLILSRTHFTIGAVLTTAVVVLFSLVAGSSAMAQTPSDRDLVAAAGQPHAYTINGADAEVHHRDFMWSTSGRSAAAIRANTYVHDSSGCGSGRDSLCTIQIFNGDRYRVYHFEDCGLFGLDNFTGLFETHNWQPRRASLIKVDGNEANYWSGRADAVDWTPVARIRTCA